MEELNVNAQALVEYANVLKAISHPARLCIVKGLVTSIKVARPL